MRLSTILKAATAVAGLAIAALAVAAPAQAQPAEITLSHTTYQQTNGWACGPYASKIVLTTFGYTSSISTLESEEGTTTNGTNSVANISTGLNYYLTAHGDLLRYKAVYPNGSSSTVKHYLLSDIYGGNGFVANVVGYENDVNGNSRGYGSGGHYVAVVGYRNSGDQALISDPGDGQDYWMTTSNLTRWIGSSRGLSVTP